MSPLKGSGGKDSFTFLSFLQCNRLPKSYSNDSGISSTSAKKNYNINGINNEHSDVIEIDDDSDEPEFEMLCEVEFNANDVLPQPIAQSLNFKTEPESIPPLLCSPLVKEENQEDSNPQQRNTMTNFHGEREEELLPLFKMEPGTEINESSLKGNDYILYICPQCGLNFDTSSKWKTHLDSVHNLFDQRTYNFTQQPNNKFQCNKCNAVITRCTLKSVQQHCFSHMPFKVYKCKLCLHETQSLYLMISHILLHKEREEVDIIEANEDSEVAQRNSALEHESKQFISHICPVCGVSFDTEDAWQAHINFRHNFLEKTAENRFKDHFKCSECNVEIFSQHVADLQQHLFTHLPYNSYLKCKLCNWTVSRRSFMMSHIFNLHKSHLSPEAQCFDRLSVSLPNVLNNNYATEERIAPDIPTRTNLAVTLTANSDQTFDSPEMRNAQSVSNYGKYACKYCKRNFCNKVDMVRHKCLKKMPLQCSVCFKEYNYVKCYQSHVRQCQLTQRRRTVHEN